DEVRNRIHRYTATYRTMRAVTAATAGAAPPPGAPGTSPRTLEELRANEATLVKLQRDMKQEVVELGNKRLNLRRLELELTAAHTELEQLGKRMEVLR